jgi:hypothetical protein
MTPKEIAKKLIDRFINIEYLRNFEGMDKELAKQCALILCDELIYNTDVYSGWEEVKSEVEKYDCI